MPDLPPTIIVVHPREKRSKCSVEPLRGRSDFVFWKYPYQEPEALQNSVRLGFGGPLLSQKDRAHGLLLLDGTWKLAAQMEADFQDIPVRSLLPWQTAYPRRSKLYDDPAAGLATIEALFAALFQMGTATDDLLDSYRWKDEFLQRNRDLMNGQKELS